MLLAAVVMVLLIACANIASLLLARATVRDRDLAVRAALGASWRRLVRQLLLESLVLSAAGAAFGVVLAWWGVDVLRAAMPDVPRVTTIGLDFRVLTTAVAVTIATGLLSGIGPALQAARPDLSRAMRDTGRSGNSPVRQRLRSALVVAEVSLAVVLLVGAALFIGSFVALMRVDPGFDTTNVLAAQITPLVGSVSAPADRREAFAEIVDRVGALPGVEHAALLLGQRPLTDGISSTSFPLPDGQIARLSIKRVSPAYHAVLRIFAVLPDVPLRNVTTIEEMFSQRMAQRRLNMLLLALFGLLGLTIAGAGMYGLMAFVVAQKTREIGVRMALGASRERVVGTVVVHALALVAAGIALGSSLAWYLSDTARAFLFGIGPTDPRAFAAAAVSLLAAALVATIVPAWRAASVDPVSVLRAE
jgi:predicted lysophospholipase L1 biosynthesis ABC-type transport system permease subunit